jgi:hypothetical protein
MRLFEQAPVELGDGSPAPILTKEAKIITAAAIVLSILAFLQHSGTIDILPK